MTTLRLKRGLSLQQVADAVGVSKAHIWQLEKGRTDNPSLTLLKGIADHFGVSVAWLIGEDPTAADADPQAERLFRQARNLDPDDAAFIEDMMQMMLRRRRKDKPGG